MIARHPVQRHLSMVCFDDGSARFQMRAAGIAIRDGRVLVQNVEGERDTVLPGGRIDQDETSAETVLREMREEFGQAVELGPLAFVMESFFPEKEQTFHEIGFYYRMTVPETFPYHATDVCHRFREGPVTIEYRWVEASPDALAACRLFPSPLRSRLRSLPQGAEHILDRAAPGW